MVVLVATAYLLPFDLFHTANLNSDSNSSNSTIPIVANDTMTNIQKRDLTNIIQEQQEQPSSIKYIWYSIYWIQFVLCWLIIPVLISYISLKYELPRGKVRERMSKAIFQNVKFYSLCLVGIVIGIIYLVTSTGHSIRDFKPLLISLAHLYSLSYTLILLSTGLIIFPRDLLSKARSPTLESNNKLFVELSKVNDDLNDSQLNILDNASKILNSNELTNGDVTFNELLNECKLEIQTKLSEIKISPTITNPIGTSSPINTLSKLNKNYNKFIVHYYNFIYNKTHSDEIIHTLAQSHKPSSELFKRVTLTILGLLSFILSLLILFLEIIPTKWAHGWIFLGNHWYNFALEFIILHYNTMTSLYSMSKFKFISFHLIPSGQSNPSNALYYSLYSSRLLFPLCFNLMVLIPSAGTGLQTSFETTLYNDLELIPLVHFLNKYLPMIFMILIPVSYKYDLKQKILLKVLGEEYYYQFFGMMMYEPTATNLNGNNNSNDLSPLNPGINNRSRIDDDYEYSLQDGRYLFERVSGNFNLENTTPTTTTTTNNNNNNGSYV